MYNIYKLVREQQEKQQEALSEAARQRLYRQMRADNVERKPGLLLRLARLVIHAAPKREPRIRTKTKSGLRHSVT